MRFVVPLFVGLRSLMTRAWHSRRVTVRTSYSRRKRWLLLLCGSVLIAQTAVTVQQRSPWTTWQDKPGERGRIELLRAHADKSFKCHPAQGGMDLPDGRYRPVQLLSDRR